jgi:hypothetical protein
MIVPTKVVVQYSHGFSTTPHDNKAGAKNPAGFIYAPDIMAKKKMPKPTIAPITKPPKPLKPFVYVTTRVL